MEKIEKKCRRKLAGIRLRLILSLILRQLETSLLSALALAALAVLTGRLLFPYMQAELYVVGVLLGVPVATLVTAGLKWFTSDTAARYADHELMLKERVYSALEIYREQPGSRFAEPLLKDAEQHIEKVDPSRTFPVRPGRRMLHAAITAMVLIGIFLLPGIPDILLNRLKSEKRKKL